MKLLRVLYVALVLLLGNLPYLILRIQIPFALMWAAIIVVALWYLAFQWIPVFPKGVSLRIKILSGGHELLWNAAAVLLCQISILIAMQLFILPGGFKMEIMLFSGVVTFVLLAVNTINGALRVILTSKQTKLIWKVLLMFTMWIPLWNFFLVAKVCNIVRGEYIVEANLQRADTVRKENEICKTKYPIVMVHGIFFRDWQLLNYWGRVPYELIKNGATVFYGHQESALPVAESALQVKKQIEEVLQTTGAEKVNVIAHSKGGLDTRYAISQLGLAPYVATLTTVNTPHHGCKWADTALDKIPQKIVNGIGEKYNGIFHRLGDQRPDFCAAVRDLTASSCERLNEQMPDAEGVFYQSVMSKMKKWNSAGFPLNLVYLVVKRAEGDNDGLVPLTSASHGKFLGIVKGEKKRGVSHGDMIDLMRENIPGFDVREFYIDLVRDLKAQGF